MQNLLLKKYSIEDPLLSLLFSDDISNIILALQLMGCQQIDLTNDQRFLDRMWQVLASKSFEKDADIILENYPYTNVDTLRNWRYFDRIHKLVSSNSTDEDYLKSPYPISSLFRTDDSIRQYAKILSVGLSLVNSPVIYLDAYSLGGLQERFLWTEIFNEMFDFKGGSGRYFIFDTVGDHLEIPVAKYNLDLPELKKIKSQKIQSYFDLIDSVLTPDRYLKTTSFDLQQSNDFINIDYFLDDRFSRHSEVDHFFAIILCEYENKYTNRHQKRYVWLDRRGLSI